MATSMSPRWSASSSKIPPVFQDQEQFDVWLQLKNAVATLISFIPAGYIPEVGMNMVYALPRAIKRSDVCGIEGRITRFKNKGLLCGSLEFGASKHVASIVLAAMSSDPHIRSAVNIRYTEKILQACRKLGFSLGSFDRKEEPATPSSTMEWGTKQAILSQGSSRTSSQTQAG